MARTPLEVRSGVAAMWRDGAHPDAIRAEFGLTPGQLAGIAHRLKAEGLIQPRRQPNGSSRPVILAPQPTIEREPETLDLALCKTDLERQVITLWNARHQAQAIAEHLGMSSPRAVQGMVGRIMNRRDGVVWKREYRPRAGRKQAEAVEVGEVEAGFGRAKLPPRRPDNVAAYPDVPLGPVKGCLWPMWGDRERPTHVYCCAPVKLRSYCAEHAARAYHRVLAP